MLLGSFSVSSAQDGVRLGALPSPETARGQKPLLPSQGFNAANASAAVVGPPRRAVTRTVAVSRTQALPPPGAGASQADALQYRASGLRLIGAASLDGLRKALAVDEAQAAAGLLTTASPVEARQLARFIGQSTQFVSVSGDTALVGWWHPIDDAWIISTWRQTGGGWRMAAMGALVGADLASAPLPATDAAPLAWPRAMNELVPALDAQNQSGIRNFMLAVRSGRIDSVLADGARQSRAWKAIRERRAMQEAMLFRAAQMPGYGDIPRLVADAVQRAGGQAVAANRETTARLKALPANARATLRPIMAVQQPGGKTFLVQSPLAPAFLALVRTRDPAGTQRATATDMQVFSLWMRDSQ